MHSDLILTDIAKHISLEENEISYFTSLLRPKTIKRKEHILKEGELCNTISYVNSGALRAYCVTNAGKEATVMFAVNGWWITDMYCFVRQRPAMMYIEAIENSEIVQLSKDNQDNLFVRVPKFEKFFRILLQNAYTREQLRIIQNLSLPAEERYENFLQKYPQIAQQVTQKQIASYLGVTPEFLSEIRKRKKIRI